MPGDSTVNQLTFLYDTFCHALDSGKEVRVVFCDISKAFDRVWHASLIKKLKTAGIAGSLLNWFIGYLKYVNGIKQRVTFSGVKSYWNSLKAGVQQCYNLMRTRYSCSDNLKLKLAHGSAEWLQDRI